MNQQQLLEHIGLSSNEAKVYLALLKYKKATVTKLAKEAHINRTTAYDVLEYLNKKGLVLKYVDNKKTGFTIDSPKRLKAWIKAKEQGVKKEKQILDSGFSDIEYLFKATPQAPRVQYFHGNNQIDNFFNDILETHPPVTFGYASSSLMLEKLSMGAFDEKYVRHFARERFRKNIPGKYIVQKADRDTVSNYLKKYYGKYVKKNPEIIRARILPHEDGKHFLNEMNIYGNKTSISHLGGEFFGVIIESEDVANTQRIVFESLWKTLTEEIDI